MWKVELSQCVEQHSQYDLPSQCFLADCTRCIDVVQAALHSILHRQGQGFHLYMLNEELYPRSGKVSPLRKVCTESKSIISYLTYKPASKLPSMDSNQVLVLNLPSGRLRAISLVSILSFLYLMLYMSFIHIHYLVALYLAASYLAASYLDPIDPHLVYRQSIFDLSPY